MPGLPQRPGLLLGKILASAAQSSQFQSVREFGTDRQAAIQYGTQMAGELWSIVVFSDLIKQRPD